MSKLNREQIGELLSAYLDGETDQRETQFVEHLLREDASAREELERLRDAIDLVGHLPRHPAPPSIAEDLRNRMERDALLGSPETSPVVVVQSGVPRGSRLSIAAMIGLVAIMGVWFLRDRGRVDRPVNRLAQVDQAKRPDAFRDDLAVKASRDKTEREPSRHGSSRSIAKNTPDGALRKTSRKRRSKPVAPAPRSRLEDHAATAPAAKGAPPTPHKPVHVEAKRANATTLRAHAFAQEPLRLRIGVADRAHRDEAVRSLVALMARQRIAPLGTQLREGAKDAATTRRFYYRGDPGINFDDADTAQMLVRVASQDLPKLVDGLTQFTKTDDVSLVAGPLVFDGLEETRSTLKKAREFGLTRSDAVSKAKSSENRLAEVRKSEPAATPSLNGLLEMFGVDPVWSFRVASRPGSNAQAEDKPVSGLDAAGVSRKAERAVGASPTTPPPDVAQVKDARAENEHPSLVERGLYSVEHSMAHHRASEMPAPAAAGRSHEGRDQPPAMATEAVGPRNNGPSDRLVTLVIEFFVAKQDAPRVRPTRSGTPKDSRVKTKKPSSEQRPHE